MERPKLKRDNISGHSQQVTEASVIATQRDLEVDLPALGKPSGDCIPADIWHEISWETLSENYSSKPFLDSCPSETVRHDIWLLV